LAHLKKKILGDHKFKDGREAHNSLHMKADNTAHRLIPSG